MKVGKTGQPCLAKDMLTSSFCGKYCAHTPPTPPSPHQCLPLNDPLLAPKPGFSTALRPAPGPCYMAFPCSFCFHSCLVGLPHLPTFTNMGQKILTKSSSEILRLANLYGCLEGEDASAQASPAMPLLGGLWLSLPLQTLGPWSRH